MLRTRLFQGGRTWFLGLQGAVDGESEPQLRSLQIGGLPPDCRRLILDFRQVDYIDSQGVRWLLRLRDVLAAQHIDLRLVVSEGSRVDRALSLLAIANLFPIFRNPMEAWRRESTASVPA